MPRVRRVSTGTTSIRRRRQDARIGQTCKASLEREMTLTTSDKIAATVNEQVATLQGGS